jgi:hypothetical protein
MNILSFLVSAMLVQNSIVDAYSTPQQPLNRQHHVTNSAFQDDQNSSPAEVHAMSRRGLLRTAAAFSAGALLGNVASPRSAIATDDDAAVPLYFGVGVSTK